MEVKIDSGNWIAAAGTTSWTYQWNTKILGDGSHTINARSLDNRSAYSTIQTLTLTVTNNLVPSCKLLSPVNDEKVSGVIIISANASDDKKVVKVEFLVNNKVIGSDTSTPYSITWDTTSVPDGIHNLTGKAYDERGAIGLSPKVRVLVYNHISIMELRKVIISPTLVNMTLGNYTIFSAQAYDLWNQVIPSTYTWSVDPPIGLISYITTQNIIFMGISTGIADLKVTALYNGITKNAVAKVNITVNTPGTFVIIGTVKDTDGNPVANATVRLDAIDGSYSKQTKTNETGAYVFMDVPIGKIYKITVIIDGETVFTCDNLSSDTSKAIVNNIRLKPLDSGLILGFSVFNLLMLIFSLGMLGAFIGLAFTEVAKYSILSAIIVPMYSRLKREETLDHFVRGQVFDHIRKNPGTHYNEMKKDLGVNNGTLAYHLRVLELQGFIKAERQGLYKRFYDISVKDTKGKGIRFSELQQKIIETVKKQPGMSQTDIAKELDVSISVVNYNIKILIKNKAIRVESMGSKQICFVILPEVEPTV